MKFLCAEGGGSNVTTWIFVALLVVLVLALLVVPMFTNKKRQKQTSELHNSLAPGDLIMTVGGIIGTIKEINQISPIDKEMIIETGDGDNKTTMTLDIQALYKIIRRSGNASATQTASAENIFDEPAKTAQPEASEEPVVKEEATPDAAQPAEEEPAVKEEAAVKDEEVQNVTEPTAPAETAASAPKSNTAKKTTGAKKTATKSSGNSTKK